jgi:hypothetical protein
MDAKRIEEIHTGLTYYGYAGASIRTTDAHWLIKKVEVIGNETITSFARTPLTAEFFPATSGYTYKTMSDPWNDDSGFFNKKWTLRTGYTYISD